MVISATAEEKFLGSIILSGKVLLGFSITNFLVAITESLVKSLGNQPKFPLYTSQINVDWI